MSPEKRLWQAVLFQAFRDATYTGDGRQERIHQRKADAWIRAGGKDFRQVCSLAGMDPAFLRDAYIGGRVDAKLLRSNETVRP